MPHSHELTPVCAFTPTPLVPRYCTSALNRVCDLFWENWLGIHTRGKAGPSRTTEINCYGFVAYRTSRLIFNHLQPTPADVIVDLGAGKGRVVCIAARLPVKRVVGIEIEPHLAADAKKNLATLRGRQTPVEIRCQSATDYDFADATIITLFNPFGSETMREVLGRLQQSLETNPRPVRIAYCNPVLSPMLAAKPWLELYECWNLETWSRLKFPIHFYRTVGAQPGDERHSVEPTADRLE